MKDAKWAVNFIRKHGMGALCECGKEETPCLGCEAVAIIEKEITRTPPVPVDTIAVPREVLQGVREAIRPLENLGTHWQGQGVMGSQMFIIGTAVAAPCRELLASLDAVLAEGE